MTWRKNSCPIYASQDGVCGCGEYWERKNSRTQPKEPTTPTNSTRLKSPSTTPPGPPREICFFWYHGTCRRGADCKLAHEFHITWLMTPPPGFVHFEPCDLPLCPLRQDLVAFKDNQKSPKQHSQIGGQVDGAAMSYMSRDTLHATSSDGSSVPASNNSSHRAEDAGSMVSTSLIEPRSKPLNGSYSDTSDSASGSDIEEGVHVVNAEPQHSNPHVHDASATSSSPPLPDSMDYFDLSGYAPMPSSSDTEEEPMLLLSHTGTLGKRKRNTSPDGCDIRNTRSKREPTPELGEVVSIMERNRSLSNWDVKPWDSPDQLPMKPPTQSTYAMENTVPKATTPTLNESNLQIQTEAPINPLSIAPKGPRALGGGSLVCFYWYHKGHCLPKRRNGRMGTCAYAHSLDGQHPQVSLPPGITDHNPDCSLPLCPVRLTTQGPDTSISNTQTTIKHERTTPLNYSTIDTSVTRTNIKPEPATPLKFAPVLSAYSSSPRDGIPEARASLKGPKFTGNPHYQQLPKLTGANRQRLKAQKRAIEAWQAEHGIRPYDKSKEIEERRGAKRAKKQEKRRVKWEKRLSHGTMLDYGENEVKIERDPNDIAIPARVPSKKNKKAKTRRRAEELFERDAGSAGVVETFDPEAERRKDSFVPIEGFSDYGVMRDGREDVGDKQKNVGKVMGMSDESEYGSVPSSWGQLGATQANAAMQYGVDDPASDGSRLDWDTDEVRQLFGGFE